MSINTISLSLTSCRIFLTLFMSVNSSYILSCSDAPIFMKSPKMMGRVTKVSASTVCQMIGVQQWQKSVVRHTQQSRWKTSLLAVNVQSYCRQWYKLPSVKTTTQHWPFKISSIMVFLWNISEKNSIVVVYLKLNKQHNSGYLNSIKVVYWTNSKKRINLLCNWIPFPK